MNKGLKFLLSQEVLGSVIVIVISIIVFMIVKDATIAYINKKKKGANQNKKKRLSILYFCVSILKYVIFLIDVVIILSIFDVDVSAFLAGLGLFGVVIGLALQDMLKDFIAGIFIILDSQYSVGDSVCIDDFKGEVVAVGLKCTKVRNYSGDIKIFSNREISNVVNLSQSNSKAIVDFTFSSDVSLVKLEEAVEKLSKRLKNIPDAVGKLEYRGVQEYQDSKITIRVKCDTKPTKQYTVESEILREAKLLFDEMEIKIK